MKMNTKAIREMISAYIDDELDVLERRRVEEILKSDARWDAEYKAMKKTALLLSRVEKLAVPEDMVKRVSTSISLSGADKIHGTRSTFSLNFARSPVFQYMATVVALALIVLSGSYFLLMRKNQEKEAFTNAIQSDQEWLDRQVAKQDKEMLKDGYRWYFLRLEQDGSFKIIQTGESKPKTAEEAEALRGETKKIDNKKSVPAEKTKTIPGLGYVAVNTEAKPAATPVEEKKILESKDKKIQSLEEEKMRTADELKKASAELNAKEAAKSKLEEKETTTDSATTSKSPMKEQAKKDVQPPAAAKGSPEPSRIAQGHEAGYAEDRDTLSSGPSTRRYRSRNNTVGIADGRITAGLIKLQTPPRLEEIPRINIKHEELIKNNKLKARIELDAEGSIISVEIITGSGSKWLDSSVRRALMKARFSKPEELDSDGMARFDLDIEIK